MNLFLLSITRLIIFFLLLTIFTPALTLSKKEKDWIVKHPIVKVGGGPDWAPFDFVTEHKYNGIANDYLRIISKKTGLHFQIEIDIWKNNLQKAKEGLIDLLPAIYYTEERSKYLQYSQEYFTMLDYFFVRNDLDVETLNDLNGKIAAIPEDFAEKSLLQREFPLIKILTVKTFSDAIDAVLEKRADILFDTYMALTYVLQKEAINTIIPFKSYRKHNGMKLYMATSHHNHTLITILNKALKEISHEDKQNIRNKWIDFNDGIVIDYTLVYQILGFFLFFILGTWLWYRKLHQEISKRKASEAQMGMLIDNIPLNVIVSDYEGNVLRANTFALETFGVSEEEIYKYNVQNFYADDTERESLMQEIRSKGKVTNSIVKFRRLDEKEMDVLMSIIPIRYDEKNALLSIIVDMSERIEMEEDLREEKKVAERANKSKSEFLANMSHEIRTPMNAIMGFTDLLDEQIQDMRLKSYTKTIKNAGQTLLTLINDILDLSKIEAGKLEIHRTAVNVHDIVEDVASMFSLTARAKGLSIVLEVDDEIPTSLLIDGIRLRQVLVNLVGNAVKFTDEGYIKLCIYAFNVDEYLSKLDLEISVKDTGVGIAKDQRERIFNSFEQQEGQDNRKFGGTGLGLSISKRLVEMMDGSIMVQSEEDRGATFFIYLYGVDISSTHPLEEHTSLAADEHICFAKAKILVVDDIADNRALILHIFEGSKIEIVTASNGKEAIAQYQKEKPDLILMDIRMPVMDGYAATSKIKKLGDIPIIALTASVMQDEYEQEKSKEFDGYLRKPILKKDLFLALSHFLAYETVIESKEVAKNEAIVLESIPKKEREVLKMYLKTKVEPSYLVAVRSNNISEIEHFNDALEQLSKIYKIERLESYCAELKHAIEVFDIVQIQILLKAYKTLIENFFTPSSKV